ncbi:hypothetical protein TSAR_012524, partial [Trichomalopsis sarcophagae]
MQDNEDNEEDMMDVDYNNLDKELKAGKCPNQRQTVCIGVWRGRMSVENERLEMRLSEQEKAMNRRMKEMEKRMQKVESGLMGIFDNIEEKIVNMCGSVIERVCGSMNLNDARESAQPGTGRTAAAPEKSYALIVKGDKEKLMSMEIKRRMVESIGEERN